MNDKIYLKEYYQRNKEKLKQRSRDRHHNNRDEILLYKKEYYKNNRKKVHDRFQRYYKNNKEKIFAHAAEFYKQNRQYIISRNVKYRRKRYKTCLTIRKSSNLRHRVSSALTSQTVSKSQKTPELLGCSIAFFKDHLSYL